MGWLHTLGSLPAIPLAAYMLARHGRIVPASRPGRAYFWFMLLGAASVLLIAHQPVSYVFGILTLVLLLLGYGASRLPLRPGARAYVETVALSMTVFLLMVPSVSETLRRLPAGHPLVTDLKDPLLLGAQFGLLAALVVGIGLQVVVMRKRMRAEPV
ncbi:MAG TPA: hypothetical protein VD865_14870 [Stenotrophomonas sp.]|nr:hypothetical protein [Stenotrophomonas sp.]